MDGTVYLIIYILLSMTILFILFCCTWEYIELRFQKNKSVDISILVWFMSSWDKTVNLFHKTKAGQGDANVLSWWEFPELIKKRAIRIILGWILILPIITGGFFLLESLLEKNQQNAIPGLIRDLEDEDKWREAIYKLADYGELEPLTTAYHFSSNPSLKSEILETLINIDNGGATGALIVILNDEDPAIRTAAAEALAQIAYMNVNERALMAEPLIAVLKDQSPTVRERAALGLGRIGDKRAVEPLIALLNDLDQFVRVNTAHALIEIGDDRAEAPLMAAFERNDLAIIARESAFFIEKAKAGTEPIFIAALTSFGTKETANNYLNCGNTKLYSAAIEWAKLNGYEIGSTSNRENSASWGGN